jgi:hypothetical protein
MLHWMTMRGGDGPLASFECFAVSIVQTKADQTANHAKHAKNILWPQKNTKIAKVLGDL